MYSPRNPIVFYIVGIIIVLVIFCFMFFSAPVNFPKGQVFSITQGENLRHISLDLKTKKIIRSRAVFDFFVILYGGEKHIVPGDYVFESNLSVFQIAERISRGEYHLAPIKVTIPEGFSVSDMADIFVSKLPNFDKGNFLMEAKSKEGYLFPDTYFFFYSSSEDDVLRYLEDNYERKVIPLRPEIIASGKTEADIITMASIIEKEAKGDNDRSIIAGILWNRLMIGMPLQVDAVPSSYKEKGLPKNPICNPGLEAIKAAIHPENSAYLFYLHDKNGMIHFAQTFAEHKKNILKYLK